MVSRVEFLRLMDELLELAPGTLTGNETLTDLPMWDSLAVISFIAMVDEQLSQIIAGDRLVKAKTIADLVDLAFERAAA